MRKYSLILTMTLAALMAAMLPGELSAQAPLFYESFDSITAGIPAGWNNEEGTTTNASYRWQSDGSGHSGRCVRFDSYWNMQGLTNMLKTPTLDLSEGGVLSFWYRNPTGGDLSVYVSTDNGATYPNPVISGLTSASTWTYVELSITDAAQGSSTVKIVFQATSNYGNGSAYIYLDDVMLMPALSCAAPENIAATALLPDSVVLGWSLGVDGSVPGRYYLAVTDDAGASVFADSIPAGRSCGVGGLAPNTTYHVQLRGDCSDNYDGYSSISTYTFTTPCLIDTVPYYEDFASGVLPPCIISKNATLDSTVRQGNTGCSLVLRPTVSEESYVVFPELAVPSDSVEVEFRIKAQSVSGGRPRYMVGLVADLADIATSFEPIRVDELTGTGWQVVRLNTLLSAGGRRPTARVCIFLQSGIDVPCYLDNVDIHRAPSCLRPEDLAATGFSTTTVSLSYTTTNAANVRAMIVSGTDTAYQSLTGNPCTVTGLMPHTDYEIRLRGECGGGDVSAWSSTSVVLHTACNVADSVYFDEDFETIIPLTGAPACWSQGWITKPSGNTLTQPFVRTSASHSGRQAMALERQATGSVAYLSSQAIPVATAGAYDVAIWVRRDYATAYTGENIAVWVNTVPNSIVGGTCLGTISRDYHTAPAEQSVGWYHYYFPINTTGTLYVMLVGTSLYGGQLVFDDVAVVDHKTCMRVKDITDNGLGGTGGLDWSVGWTATSGESAWQVTATVNAATTVTTVTAPAFTLTGLEPSTVYGVSLAIRALCAPGDTSDAALFNTSFSTPCRAVRSVMYDAEDASFPPTCWQRGSTASGYYPQRSGVQKHDGLVSVNFPDMQIGNSSWMVSPLIDFGSDSTVYTIDFWFYRSGYDAIKQMEGIEVYVGPSADYTSDTRVLFVPREMTVAPVVAEEGFYNYSVNVPDSIRGLNYVIFRYRNEYGAGSYIDDIIIEPVGYCRAQQAAVSDVTVNSAVVNVDLVGARQQVAYGPQGTPVAGCTVIDTVIDTVGAAMRIRLTGLADNTAYTVYVRRVCSPGDTSEWSPGVDFTTLCNLADLPLVADGEDATFPPACWQVFSTGNYLPVRYNVAFYANTGGSSIKFPDQQAGNYSILSSPSVVFDADSSYIISLSAYRASAASFQREGLAVYISDNATDTTGATLVEYVHRHYGYDPVEAGPGYYDYSRTVSGISGNKYVLFCYFNEYGSQMYVDDITIANAADCLAMSARAGGATESRVVITANVEADTWQIAYGTALTPDSMAIVTVTDTSVYTLTGLAARTTYHYYVRRVCQGGDTSAWSRMMGTFSTTAVPQGLPFYCGFESAAQTDRWVIRNSNNINTLAVGTEEAAVCSGTGALYVQSGGAYGYDGNTATDARAYTLLRFEPKVYRVEFRWRCTGGESAYDYGRVLLVPAGIDPASVTSYGDVPAGAIEFGRSVMADGSTYQDHRLNLTPGDSRGWNAVSDTVDMTAGAGNYHLLVFWHSDYSVAQPDPLAVDNFYIYELTCLNPTVQVSGLSSTGATLSYSSAEASQYEVVVSDRAISPDEITDDATFVYRGVDTVGHATVDSLRQNTIYYYTVRTYCLNGDTAAWAAPGSFTTYCGATTLPYSETFEAANSMNCWTTFAGRAPAERNTQYQFQGLASMRIHETQAISPEFIADSLNHYMITGYAYSATAGAQLGVGLITDPNDPATYETFGNCTIKEANGWTEFTVMFTDLDDPDYADYRSARNIVLTAPTGTTIYVDNVRVEEMSDCPKPTEPVLGNVTANTVDISFTDNASATAWVVQVNGARRVVTSENVTITGLKAHTTYDLYVAAICASGDTSDYTFLGRVTTACGVMSLPYAEGFEQMPPFANSGVLESNCWLVWAVNGYGSATVRTTAPGNPMADVAHSGTQGLYVTTVSDTEVLGLPMFGSLNGKKLSFWLRHFADGIATVDYGYLTDPDNGSTYVSLGAVPVSSAWQRFDVRIAGMPDSGRPAIRATGSASLAFDDFVLYDDIAGTVYTDTVCNNADYAGHGFSIASEDLAEGLNVFTRSGSGDTLIAVQVVRLPEIATYTADTICAGRPYSRGIWQIDNPRTHRYQQIYPGASRHGCDSTVYLDLNVQPGSEVLRDTICSGETYSFGGRQLSSPGLYTRSYRTARGCDVVDSLYLSCVPDTVSESHTICEYKLPYDWHGRSIGTAGVHTCRDVGLHGCTQTFILTLDVASLDSTINVSFCSGGQAQVVDTVVSTAGSYTLERVNGDGCDVVYHINATVTAPRVEHVYDSICEGDTYQGYGLTLEPEGDTVVVINTRTADAQCDSTAWIHVAHRPTQRTEFTVAIYTGETYEWDDVTYNRFGRYSNTYYDRYGCDSVSTLNLVCKDGVEEVSASGLVRVVPNPATAGQAALVVVSGTGGIARVEVINSYGSVVAVCEPRSTPVSIAVPQVAGVYHVRVTTAEGRVYVEKLIVR